MATKIQRERAPGAGPNPAVDSRRVKRLLPTNLTSRQLELIAPEIRERALFSARVVQAEILQSIKDQMERIASGISSGPGDYANINTFKEQLRAVAKSIDYRPEEGDEGTIKDLRSDARTKVIYETNNRQAAGYGQFTQANDPGIIDAYPCQELVRVYERQEKRNWIEIWARAGGQVYEGRMIARKDDPIWTKLGPFGLPYPPFDWGSGMGLRPVGRKESIRLGVIAPGDQVTPQTRRFNEDLQMSAAGLDAQMKAALMQDVGDVAELDGDTLKWKGGAA